MESKAYETLRDYVKKLISEYSIKDLVAEVHNLFQDYLISEEQEEDLYKLVDPEDIETSPAELWYSGDYGCADLYDFAYKLA